MNDALGVSGVEGIGDFDGNFESFFQRARVAGDAMLERVPFQKLHGDEVAFGIAADFVNSADIGVVQGGGGASFAAEAFKRVGVTHEIVGKKFEGDEAAEIEILGFVDDAHAAAADFFQDAIVRDSLADQGRITLHPLGGEMLDGAAKRVNQTTRV